MPEQSKNNQQEIEQILSDFADQVIGSDNPNAVPLSTDKQINQLQETVLRLNQHAPTSASAESAEKIRKNLQLAWEKQQTMKPGVLEKIWGLLKPAEKTKRYQSRTRRQQIMVVRITTAAVLVILAAFVLMPDSGLNGGSASGAAVGGLNPWVIIGGLGLLGGVLVLLWIKSRRN